MVGALYDVNTGMANFESFAEKVARITDIHNPLVKKLEYFLPTPVFK
jgi:hypothetical protein